MKKLNKEISFLHTKFQDFLNSKNYASTRLEESIYEQSVFSRDYNEHAQRVS